MPPAGSSRSTWGSRARLTWPPGARRSPRDSGRRGTSSRRSAAPSWTSRRRQVLRVPSTCCSTASRCWSRSPRRRDPTLQRAANVLTRLARGGCPAVGLGLLRAPASLCGTSRACWRSPRKACPARPRRRRARALPIHTIRVGDRRSWARIGDFARYRLPHAEVNGVAGAIGSRLPALHRDEAAVTARTGSRGLRSDCRRDRAGRDRRTRAGGDLCALCGRGPVQRPCPLRRRGVRRPGRPPRTPWSPGSSVWVLPELVEAAVRGGDTRLADGALTRLAETTQPCGTDWALGIEARCRALLSDGAAARRPVPRGD